MRGSVLLRLTMRGASCHNLHGRYCSPNEKGAGRTVGRNNYVHRVSDPNIAEHAASSFSCMAVATATGGLSGRVDF